MNDPIYIKQSRVKRIGLAVADWYRKWRQGTSVVKESESELRSNNHMVVIDIEQQIADTLSSKSGDKNEN